MNDSVEFDPGIGQLVYDLNDLLNRAYTQINSSVSIHTKKTKFKLYSTKIFNCIRNNIAFYLGCLLWAYFLVKENNNSPKLINGNAFLGIKEEQLDDYDFLYQINLLENYLEKYKKDYLFFIGKRIDIPKVWTEILSLYKEFIEINKGFINTRRTSDIILPKRLDELKITFDIKEKIEESIENKNLEILLNIDILPLQS